MGTSNASDGVKGISVVIPTKGRPQLVDELLASLTREKASIPHPVDIAVVDDSNEADRTRIRASCEKYNAAYITGPRRVGAKRNLGAAATRHPIVLFIDSDCCAAPGLLAEHLAAHENGSPRVGAVAGPTLMLGDPIGHWSVMQESRRYNQPYTWPLKYSRLLWCTTSNLSVKRSVFEKVGGFDETTFTVVGGEDIDLGVRLAEAGYYVAAAPEAVVSHAREMPGLWPIARRMFTYGEADTYLCVRHPNRREWYPNPVSVAALAAALATVITSPKRGVLPPLAVLGGTLIVETARRAGRGTSLRRLPRQLLAVAVDLSFEAGTFYGAVRHATPGNAFRRFQYVSADEFHPWEIS